MRALVVLSEPPLPEGGAPGRAALALLRGLVAHGVDVRALAPRQPFSFAGTIPADVPVEVVDQPVEARGPRQRVRQLLRPHAELSRGPFGARVRELAAGADVLHLDEHGASWCDIGLTLPAVVNLHWRVRRDRPLGPPWRANFRQVLEFAQVERAAARRHRFLTSSSPDVAASLRAIAPRAEVVVVPLALDPAGYTVVERPPPCTAGIIGHAAWPPTGTSIRRLLDRVWPLVTARLPEARLLVAGRGTEVFAPGAPPGVDVVGAVPSSADFFSRVSVVVHPLERGSGAKVKVIEAMACGVPVVTTASGAEGVEPNEGVVVATTDEEIADAVVAILADGGEQRRRAEAARAEFDRRHAPVAATVPLVELYGRMLGQS